MGYSDTTTLLTYVNQLGLVTFHGPSVMAGFSQLQNFPLSFVNHVKQMLFQPATTFEYGPYESWSEVYKTRIRIEGAVVQFSVGTGQEENIGSKCEKGKRIGLGEM